MLKLKRLAILSEFSIFVIQIENKCGTGRSVDVSVIFAIMVYLLFEDRLNVILCLLPTLDMLRCGSKAY